MEHNHIFEGSVLRSIFKISVPVILANALQSVYQLTDTFWVGRLGAEAVAAVSLSFPILFFLTSFAMGLAMAGSILIAQYYGRQDKDMTSLTAGQTLSLTIIISVILSAIGFPLSGYLLSFLTQDANVLIPATQYLQISFIAIIAMFIYNIFQSALRGVGEVKLPMFIILVAVVLNFFLDPLFMFGYGFIPAMGVPGVALATLITEYLCAVIGIVVMLKGYGSLKVSFAHMVPRMEWLKKLLRLGLPSSAEFSFRSFGFVLMVFVVSFFGTMATAAYGIGTRIFSFVIIPAIGFALATSSLIGNNLGSKQHDRAEKIAKTGMTVAFMSLTAVGILLTIFAPQISAFFVPGEPELISTSASFIRMMAWSFGLVGAQIVIVGTIRASGKTKTVMLLVISNTIIQFVLSYVISMTLGYKEIGVWISYPISTVISTTAAYYFYARKDWLRKRIV